MISPSAYSARTSCSPDTVPYDRSNRLSDIWIRLDTCTLLCTQCDRVVSLVSHRDENFFKLLRVLCVHPSPHQVYHGNTDLSMHPSLYISAVLICLLLSCLISLFSSSLLLPLVKCGPSWHPGSSGPTSPRWICICQVDVIWVFSCSSKTLLLSSRPTALVLGQMMHYAPYRMHSVPSYLDQFLYF